MPWTLRQSDSVQKALLAESNELKKLHPNDSSRFAKDPRVIAFFALNDLVTHRLVRRHWLYSYSVPVSLVPAEHRLHCAETFGWRLVLSIETRDETVNLIDLSRVTNFSDDGLKIVLKRILEPAPQVPEAT